MRWSRVSDLGVELRQKWAASRVWAARQAPYLSSALLALDPVVVEDHNEDLAAFPVDPAWHVYLDPPVLESTAVPEIGFWLVHQVSHLLRRHPDRYPFADHDDLTTPPMSRRSAEQRQWNVAGDAEIDDDLVAGEIALPERAVTPLAIWCPEGWIAEQYWDAIRTTSADPNPPGRSRVTEMLNSCSDCGSGCDGQPRGWDCGRPGLGQIGEKLVAREVAQRIREHSRTRGDMPAGWKRWADEVLEPAVSWQRVLSSMVRRGVADVAGRVDFSYRRPSRRASAVPDVVLPSLRQPIPHVAMVLDTSGSMSDQMLGQALAEVSGVLRGLGVGRRHLRVVCCDAQAYEAQRVLDASEVRLVGGGGPDMGIGLAVAAGLKPRPDIVIVLTDGHTPWPAIAPVGNRVIVGLMDPNGTVPEWATAVAIEPPTRVSGW
jgi:predicted metal-dependent peptidase